MFAKSHCLLAALAAPLLLSGCITTETTISINPDGSGTVEYTTDFDRASEEVRNNIRAQLTAPNSKPRNSKENLLEDYPAPHFEIVTVEHDFQELRSRIVLRFNDINALLIPRKKTDLGLKALDFEADGENLLFSIKEKKPTYPWPEKFDNMPGLETITIVNAASDEKVVFSRELNSKTPPADWTASLAFPGHHIVRTPDLQIFRDDPVVKTGPVQIEEANWMLESDTPFCLLKLKTDFPLPQDGFTYLYWKNPVVLSGRFLPDLGKESRIRTVQLLQNYYPTPVPFLELGLSAPTQPIESLSPTLVRLEAVRCQGSETVEVGPLKPDTEYAFDGYTLKTADLANNKLGFALTGDSRRVKNAILQTHRGNRFVLQRAGYGATSTGTTRFSYFESIPLAGCTLYLELYNPLKPCYIDVAIPRFDLTQRNWLEEKPVVSNDWKRQVVAEFPDLAETKTPPFDATLFEDKAAYAAYFKGLRDEQLLPAIFEVVGLMVQHGNPQNAQMWIQSIARPELRSRTAYLDTHRPQIADRLFSIYAHTPKKMVCLPGFFSSLNLRKLAQPKAIEMLQCGRFRFADDSFFTTTLSEREVAVLKQAFEATKDDWITQKNIIEILSRAQCADTPFLFQILEDRTDSKYVRVDAFRLLMQSKPPDHTLAKRIALDATEEPNVRIAALGTLLENGPFPEEALLSCLADSHCQDNAVNALNSFLNRFLRDHADDTAACAKMEKALQPIIPWLEDLSELPTKWKAQRAASTLEKIEKLRTPQTHNQN